MGLRRETSLDKDESRCGSNWNSMYRNTNVTTLVKTSGLDRIEIVDNGGLGQTVRVDLSSLETNDNVKQSISNISDLYQTDEYTYTAEAAAEAFRRWSHCPNFDW